MTDIDRLESAISSLGRTVEEAVAKTGKQSSDNASLLYTALDSQADLLDRIANALERIADKMEED